MPDVLLPLAAAAEPVPATCAHCAAPLAGRYCAACGQRAPRGRLTLRSIAAHLVTDALDLNRGLLFTLVELFRRPGGVARDYVRGSTVSYTNPVKYFLIVGAVTTLVYVKTGLAGQLADEVAFGMRFGSNGEIHPRAGAVLEILNSYFTLLLAFTLPTTALASRLAFRRAGYNYAEHLVFNTYVGAQQSLIIIAALVLGSALGGDPSLAVQWSAPAAMAYIVWAAMQFAGGPRGPAFARALLAIVLTYVGFGATLGVVSAVSIFVLRLVQ